MTSPMSLSLPNRLPLAVRRLSETPVKRSFALAHRAPGVEIRLRPRRAAETVEVGQGSTPSATAPWLFPIIIPNAGVNIP